MTDKTDKSLIEKLEALKMPQNGLLTFISKMKTEVKEAQLTDAEKEHVFAVKGQLQTLEKQLLTGEQLEITGDKILVKDDGSTIILKLLPDNGMNSFAIPLQQAIKLNNRLKGVINRAKKLQKLHKGK